ncbi:MAG: threonine/serine exporter ThrE family protein [Dysgonomonas sp.]
MDLEISGSKGISSKQFAVLILDIGTFLLASGAHCGRIYSNIKRLADVWGFDLDMQPSFKGLLVTVKNLNNADDTVTLFKESPVYHAHLSMLTQVSHLTWEAVEKNLSIEEVRSEFLKIKNTPNYRVWIISLAVGISCAGLCLLSFGDMLNALVAFLGASIGSIFRYRITKMQFNPMIAIIVAAFITTIITGLGSLLHIGSHPEVAMATAVLYLIPGVPLINCVIDLLEGYLSSAMNRALFSGFILLCIAVGMTLSITLMGINNFN